MNEEKEMEIENKLAYVLAKCLYSYTMEEDGEESSEG